MSPFISVEELLEAQQYVDEKLKSNPDWVNGFLHKNIYNRVNYTLGVLKKVEIARRSITIESLKELIKLLYILGYGIKQITYLCFEWGFKQFTLYQVQTYISKNKYKFEKEKEELMSQLIEAKKALFQDMQQQFMVVEKEKLETLFVQLKRLNEHLTTLDPITQSTQFKQTLSFIERLEKSIKDSHGIDDIRKSMIEANKSLIIEEGRAAIEKGESPFKELETINNNNKQLVEL